MIDLTPEQTTAAQRELNPYGKRTSPPEPGQTWRVRVPRSSRCDGKFVECDGVMQANRVAFLKHWWKLEVMGRIRYVHSDNMLYMVAGAPVRAHHVLVYEHDVTCHYRIAAINGAADKCPHGCEDSLDCELCYLCTCKNAEAA